MQAAKSVAGDRSLADLLRYHDKPEAGSYLTTARGNDPHQAAAAAVCFPPQPTVEVGSRAL